MIRLWLIPALWIALIIFWIASAARAKRTIDRPAQRRGIGIRLALAILAIIAFRWPALRLALREIDSYQLHSAVLGFVGTALVVLGIGLALFARIYLGRNWGMPASRKENPELITGGPYHMIRHPIYTGIIVAMLGSTIALSVVWIIPLVLFGFYFVYAARREERYMAEQFPDQYPAYLRRTKMLVPYVV